MSAASSIKSMDPDVFARRQKQLLVFAWGVTILPLVAFGYLTWQGWELNQRVHASQRELADSNAKMKELLDKKVTAEAELGELSRKQAKAAAELARLNEKLDAQRVATTHYRDLAGIRIQFYREEDRKPVEGALVKLGFRIESRLGSSPLISSLKANTIAFGSQVSDKDLRDIATALVEERFPLKRIAPATRQPDPKLIQIYASVQSDTECGLLSVEQIRAGSTCGKLTR